MEEQTNLNANFQQTGLEPMFEEQDLLDWLMQQSPDELARLTTNQSFQVEVAS
ncbi:MAG: hypothetical protein AAF446_09470 [Pseudomonadota bacterium]